MEKEKEYLYVYARLTGSWNAVPGKDRDLNEEKPAGGAPCAFAVRLVRLRGAGERRRDGGHAEVTNAISREDEFR